MAQTRQMQLYHNRTARSEVVLKWRGRMMLMRYGQVEGIDKSIPRLVQGTSMKSEEALARGFALFDEWYEAGMTAFDTAHQYGEGDVERVLGKWMEQRGVRDQVVVITKGAHHTQDRKRVTPFDITSDLFDSLARLRTGAVDLYLLHRDDESVPVGPIVDILNEHKSAGRIRAFGASNWRHERIQAANDYAHAHGLTPFAASSIHISLAEQVKEPWRDCISITGAKGRAGYEWYRRTQTPLFAWSSLSGGFFTGRFRPDNLASFSDERDRDCIVAYAYPENFERLERANQRAREKGLTAAQIALAYVINQPLNVFVLVGHQSAAEVRQNLVACDLALAPQEMDWLDLRRDKR